MATILCPVDFSESSDAAVELAVTAAKSRSASLLLLHVDPPTTIAANLIPREKHQALVREHREWIESRLASARARLRDETVDATSRVSIGAPGDEIVKAARELDAELIVMSTHSSVLRRTLLGSVAATVARRAPCPVLLVRRHPDSKLPFARALVCVDFSSASDRVAEAARGLCGRDADFELLHVVDEPSVAALQLSLGQRDEVLSLLDALHSAARAQLGELARALPPGQRSTKETVIGGPIASTIVSHASEAKAPLIVIGSHEPRGLRQRLLGTVADRVLHSAETPVLLVPAGARALASH